MSDRDITRAEAADLAEQAEDRMVVLSAKEIRMTLQHVRAVKGGPCPAEALGEFQHFVKTFDLLLTAFDEGKACKVIIEDRSGMVSREEEGRPCDVATPLQQSAARDGVPCELAAAGGTDRG